MIDRENVQVYVYARLEKKVLMLKRIPEKAGYWQPVCGGVEKDESHLAAAKRELYEETGIQLKGDLLALPFEFSYKEPKDGVMMAMRDTCFLLEIPSPVDIRICDEHERYQWSLLEEVTTLTDWAPILEVCKFIGDKV